jgi:heavy metal translocating P-type ATPase
MQIDAVNEPSVVVDPADSLGVMKVTVSIVGMTCGTCVGKISEALEMESWVQSANVTLLTNSAVVTIQHKSRVADIVTVIEDVGYEATVEHVDESPALQKADREPKITTLKASYSVGGMTCSSCIGAIKGALKKFDWIKRVDINLLSNSATVIFEGKHNLPEIAEVIEDIGYEATLNDVNELSHTLCPNRRREISIHVSGMYCDNCPPRIIGYLKKCAGEVTIDSLLSMGNPILKVSYMPNAPSFTIRHILASISTADPNLEATIYHPPTLEERSQKINAREQRRLLLRTALSIAVAIPTFLITIVFMSLVPSENRIRQFFMQPMWSGEVRRGDWASFLLACPVYFFAADIFHRRALKEIYALWKPGSTTPILQRFYRFGSMNMLMSLGTSIAFFSSISELAIAATHSSTLAVQSNRASYFDSVVFLSMFLLIGKLIEAYSRAKTGDAVTMLRKLRPKEASLVYEDDGEQARDISADLLEIGDIVRVPSGGSPPCDGYIIKGEACFDESSLTGESRPVKKSAGDEVFSGTINNGGPISIRASGISGASLLDQIVDVVREGQTRRAPVERIADILTSYFVPFVTLIAISTWIVWLGLGLSGALPRDYLDLDRGGWLLWSLQFAIAVFVIACPCGIALAAPTALFVGGGLAAQNGILVKGGGEAFQEASGLDCVVFDKTGTLTQGGEPVVTNHKVVTGGDEPLVRAMIRRLEENSSHPIAKAIVSFCKSTETASVHVENLDEIPGKGMKGKFSAPRQAMMVIIGNEALMADYNVHIPNSTAMALNSWKAQGKSISLVAMKVVSDDGTGPPLPASASWDLVMSLAVSDPLRPEASATIRALKKRGIDVWMISGDNPTTATAVGTMVGIAQENIIANVLPGQKAEKIQYLQKTLKKVSRNAFGRANEYIGRRATIAMVGDGINDSPALTMADVGVAIGSGSDIAISSADFILVSSRLDSLLTLIDLSRIVFKRIKFNFAWALVYNLIALPVAAGTLYPVKASGGHIRLDPVWASLAMALSSVNVVCSSLLLRSRLPGIGYRPTQDRQWD